MKIHADDLGYRELSRIADFIRVIENGNENFSNLLDVSSGDITIGYDVHYDSVTITDAESPSPVVLYPGDLDVDI